MIIIFSKENFCNINLYFIHCLKLSKYSWTKGLITNHSNTLDVLIILKQNERFYRVYIDYFSMVYLKEKKCQKPIAMYNMHPFLKDWNILEKSVYYKWWIHVRYFIYAFAVWNALLVVFMGINSLQTWNQNVCCVNRFMVPSWFTMCTWSWHIIMTWFSSTHYMLVYWYCPNQG